MITGKTKLSGLLGWPIGHSVSPTMHNAAAAALDLDWVYVPLPVRPEALPLALGGLAALGFRGVNVTVPYKAAVLPYLDAVYPVAQAIGAVNAIVISDGLLTGFNTDWSGFLSDLEDNDVDVRGRDCIVLGAGARREPSSTPWLAMARASPSWPGARNRPRTWPTNWVRTRPRPSPPAH